MTVRNAVDTSAGSRSGRTRDISTRGVYFMMDQDLESGAELDMTLTLPAEITRGTEVLVRAQGRVVRVDRHEEGSNGQSRVGVAAVIERYDIIRGESSTN
jgi:hypothetical protein